MRQFNTLLNQPELMALNAHSKEALAAQEIWKAIAPDNLATLSHASSIKNKQLTLFANNNTIAAKIKLFVPSLLIQLQKQGCEVTSIRVKVQVKSGLVAKPKRLKEISPQAAINLNRLANQLSGTALGDALTKLAKNSIKN